MGEKLLFERKMAFLPTDVIFGEILPSMGFDTLYDQRDLFPESYRRRKARPTEFFVKLLVAVEHDDIGLFREVWNSRSISQPIKDYFVALVSNLINRDDRQGVYPRKILKSMLETPMTQFFPNYLFSVNLELFDAVRNDLAIVHLYLRRVTWLLEGGTNLLFGLSHGLDLLRNRLLERRLGNDGKTPLRIFSRQESQVPFEDSYEDFVLTTSLLIYDSAAKAHPGRYGKLLLSPHDRIPIVNLRQLAYSELVTKFDNVTGGNIGVSPGPGEDDKVPKIWPVEALSKPIIGPIDNMDDFFGVRQRRQWSLELASRWYQMVSSPAYHGLLIVDLLDGDDENVREEFLGIVDRRIFQPEEFLDGLLVNLSDRSRNVASILIYLRGMLDLPFGKRDLALTLPYFPSDDAEEVEKLNRDWRSRYRVVSETRRALANRLYRWLTEDPRGFLEGYENLQDSFKLSDAVNLYFGPDLALILEKGRS